jgi:short subunit dehydrogenase-like uncharacterized protein
MGLTFSLFSSALLHYSKDFRYGEAIIKQVSFAAWLQDSKNGALLTAAIAAPSIFQRFLPEPGEGPDRKTMEEGFLTLHAFGTMITNNKNDDEGKEEKKLAAKFHFKKDVAYLYTAALLVQTGMLLAEKYGSLSGGVKTPAAALGSDLTQRILKEMEATFELKEVDGKA